MQEGAIIPTNASVTARDLQYSEHKPAHKQLYAFTRACALASQGAPYTLREVGRSCKDQREDAGGAYQLTGRSATPGIEYCWHVVCTVVMQQHTTVWLLLASQLYRYLAASRARHR